MDLVPHADIAANAILHVLKHFLTFCTTREPNDREAASFCDSCFFNDANLIFWVVVEEERGRPSESVKTDCAVRVIQYFMAKKPFHRLLAAETERDRASVRVDGGAVEFKRPVKPTRFQRRGGRRRL